MSSVEAQEIIQMLEDADVYQYMSREIKKSADKAKVTVDTLLLSTEQKEALKTIVDRLLPDIKKV